MQTITTPIGVREQLGFLVVDAKLIHYMNFVDCLNEVQSGHPHVPSLQSLVMMQLSTLDLEDFRHMLEMESWFVVESTINTSDTASSIHTDDDYLSFEYIKCVTSRTNSASSFVTDSSDVSILQNTDIPMIEQDSIAVDTLPDNIMPLHNIDTLMYDDQDDATIGRYSIATDLARNITSMCCGSVIILPPARCHSV